MAARKFLRYAELKIIDAVQKTDTETGNIFLEELRNNNSFKIASMKNGKDAYRITFDIIRLFQGAGNISFISIYNLGLNNISKLRTNSKVELSVGYLDNGSFTSVSVLYKGFINYVASRKESTDYVTEIQSSGGATLATGNIISQSFLKGVSHKIIIELLIKKLVDLGINFDGSRLVNKITNIYKRGIVLNGTISSVLRNILDINNLTYEIIDDKLFVYAYDSKRNISPNEETHQISENTGLIGAPEIGPYNFSFKTLLNTSIKVGDRVDIKSRFISPDLTTKKEYTVQFVKNIGDTHEGEFLTEVIGYKRIFD